MNVQNVFFNEFGRLRSGWRFTIFLLAFIFLGELLRPLVKLFFLQLGIDLNQSSLLFILVNSSISLFLAVLLGWLCGKVFESLPFRALGAWFTKNWFKDLAAGLVLGAASICFAALIAAAFGGLSFESNQTFGISAILLTLGLSFVVFAIAAAFEEAFFRGYILQTFTRAHLAWLAIVLTSIFFGLGHLGNPAANYVSTLNTILAGVWFSIAYLKTRNLWFPFGIHLAWNWVQGAIFGIEVSGIKELTIAPLFREIDTGPAWLTGGDYGLEAGVACTIALTASTLLIWFSPILKATEEMVALTNQENPTIPELSASSES